MGSLLTSAWQGSHAYTVTRTYANMAGSPAEREYEATRAVWNQWNSRAGGRGGGDHSGDLTPSRTG